MKKLLSLLVLIFLSNNVFADQLAYISKSQAAEAVEFLEKKKYVYLFCGCCDNETPEKVKIEHVSYRHTCYEDYYEVVLYYISENGEVDEKGIDLAYVWYKKRRKQGKTIAKILKYEHDSCKKLKI